MNDTERLALWAIKHGFAVGYSDTVQDVIDELDCQIIELRKNENILDWLEKIGEFVVGSDGKTKAIAWGDGTNNKYFEGKDLRDCVIKAMEEENE